jgi:hypothetical protein
MESSTLDRPTIERYLAALRARLRVLGALLDPGGGEAAAIRAAIAATFGALDDVQTVVTDPREATRVACPSCRARVMREATLCFACWRKLAPGAGS